MLRCTCVHINAKNIDYVQLLVLYELFLGQGQFSMTIVLCSALNYFYGEFLSFTTYLAIGMLPQLKSQRPQEPLWISTFKGVLHLWALFLKTLCIFSKNKATSDKVSYGSGQKCSKELENYSFTSVETIVVKLQWKMCENQYFPCFEP